MLLPKFTSPRLSTVIGLSVVVFALSSSGFASPKNDVNCIWNSSEEIFRLLNTRERQVMRRMHGQIQIASQMQDYDPSSGVSTWFACGFQKYNLEKGAVTRRYEVRLDRDCKVLPGRESVRPRAECPTEF